MYNIKVLIKKKIFQLAKNKIISNWMKNYTGLFSTLFLHRVGEQNTNQLQQTPNDRLKISEKVLRKFFEETSSQIKFLSLEECLKIKKRNNYMMYCNLTFDDGYLDNLTNALPLLEKYNIPATIFITCSFASGNAYLWWYELWEHIEKNREIILKQKNKLLRWNTNSLREKLICFSKIQIILQSLDYLHQNKFMMDITGKNKRKNYKKLFLNWDQIKKLDQHPLITIGSHTVNHPNLKQENIHSLKYEILNSKTILEEKLGHDIKFFAYPYGTYKEFGSRELKEVMEAGYEAALTTVCHSSKLVDNYSIPRLSLNNNYKNEFFLRRISGLSNFLRRQLD